MGKICRGILFLFFTLVSITIFGQDNSNKAAEIKPKANQGTYLIITDDSKYQEVFTDKILEFIEENRHETKDRVLKIGKFSFVKIPAKSTLNSKEFVPYKEEIIYSNERLTEIK